jgi:hypothetical protein
MAASQAGTFAVRTRTALMAATLALAAAGTLTLVAPPLALASPRAPASDSAKPAHQAELQGVSCARATLCMAVGYRATAHGKAPVAEKWNGRFWANVPIPAPRGTDSYLVSVSCPAAKDCTAVGGRASSPTSSGPIAEQWNGRTWHLTQTSNPRGVHAGNLAGVSCASRNDCVAVGMSQGQKRDPALTEKWNGHSWRVLTTVKLSRSAALTSAFCGRRFCMAVGETVRSSPPGEVTLAEELTNGRWRKLTTPALADAELSVLYGAWCTGPRFCVAVGQTQGSTTGTIAEVWNGSAWTVQAPSASTDILGSGILSAVSCSSSSHCMAVGAGASQPISEELTASIWTSVPTAQVSQTPFASLYQVSCPTATRCIAVGARTDGGPGDIGTSLAEEWNGSNWRVLKTRNP